MSIGKTIKLFMIDGDTNGRWACELSNWTGKAYKIPRNSIRNCTDRPELQTTGVYMLMNRNTDLSEKGQIYIGEAEDIFRRLSKHIKEKDFWNDAIVFISKNDNLNKAHIKYLENRLYEIAIHANRYNVINSQTPTQSGISESDKAEMEEDQPLYRTQAMELKKLLLNCAKFGSNVFKEALDIGLDNININMFRTMTAVSFSEIRGFISTTKLEVSQDFKKEIKNEIIYPEVEIFIEIFKFDQRQFENGELIDKLIFNSEILVKNIITQILNNFNAK